MTATRTVFHEMRVKFFEGAIGVWALVTLDNDPPTWRHFRGGPMDTLTSVLQKDIGTVAAWPVVSGPPSELGQLGDGV